LGEGACETTIANRKGYERGLRLVDTERNSMGDEEEGVAREDASHFGGLLTLTSRGERLGRGRSGNLNLRCAGKRLKSIRVGQDLF